MITDLPSLMLLVIGKRLGLSGHHIYTVHCMQYMYVPFNSICH